MTIHKLVPTAGFAPTPNCSMLMAIPEFAYCGNTQFDPLSLR